MEGYLNKVNGLFILNENKNKMTGLAYVMHTVPKGKPQSLKEWHKAFSYVNARDLAKTTEHVKGMEILTTTTDMLHCTLCVVLKIIRATMYLSDKELKLLKEISINI